VPSPYYFVFAAHPSESKLIHSYSKKEKSMLVLEKYTFGVGDRFAHQAESQLAAFEKMASGGVELIPVWNKSNREHTFIGTEPQSVHDAAKRAVQTRQWSHGWHVDADHIRLNTVDRFLPCSDFFTIDVADSIGQPCGPDRIDAFIARHPELIGTQTIPGIAEPLHLAKETIAAVADKYLMAVAEAGEIYRYIGQKNGEGNFIAEVSMDETDSPQTPPQLLVILAALADEGIRLQTIAPKFTGRFNKGVDYVGDLVQFEREFNDDLAVLRWAVDRYDLPKNLKLSVHSGSDKFSLYPIIRRALQRTGAGLHIKTAGTTWLEELIGLCESGREGTNFVKQIYGEAIEHIDELCGPYASVIDINSSKLPSVDQVATWDGSRVANTIRHIPNHPDFNANVRQLLHVAFKLAAKRGSEFTDLLQTHREVVAQQVMDNLFQRHMQPLFGGV
jgi:tagaturonate epimerase